MKRKLLNYLKVMKRNIKYKDLESLSDEYCVYIKSDYFIYLVLRAKKIDKVNENVIEILEKYKEINKIKSYLNNTPRNYEYIIMTSSDAKSLIKELRVPEFKEVFFKSSIKADVYEEWILFLEKEYNKKVMQLKKI